MDNAAIEPVSDSVTAARSAAPETAAPETAAPVISVIISSYNTRDILRDCLHSLYQNPPAVPFEVIVIDDASGDGTAAMVRTEFPAVRLLVNETNRHYAISNNRGLDAARGDYILLLNSDTIVLPGAIDGLHAFSLAHPRAGAIGCKLLNEDGTTQWAIKGLPSLSTSLFGQRSVFTLAFPNNRFSLKTRMHLTQDMTKPFLVHGYVSGAATLMPMKVVRQIGHMDEQFIYHIDADYCKRVVDAGYECYCVPTVSIIHLNHKGGTTATTRARFHSLYLFHLQTYRFFRKHSLKSAISPMGIVILLGTVAHYLLYIVVQSVQEIAAAARSRLHSGRSAG